MAFSEKAPPKFIYSSYCPFSHFEQCHKISGNGRQDIFYQRLSQDRIGVIFSNLEACYLFFALLAASFLLWAS
jgi:hypothetical protein